MDNILQEDERRIYRLEQGFHSVLVISLLLYLPIFCLFACVKNVRQRIEKYYRHVDTLVCGFRQSLDKP